MPERLCPQVFRNFFPFKAILRKLNQYFSSYALVKIFYRNQCRQRRDNQDESDVTSQQVYQGNDDDSDMSLGLDIDDDLYSDDD